MTKTSQLRKIAAFGACLISFWSCALMPQEDPGAKADDQFRISRLPTGWKKEASEKAQFLFTNQHGSTVYMNSYCDYYQEDLEKLSLEHINKLGSVEVTKRESYPIDGHRGILSTVYSKFEGHALLLYNFGAIVGDCYYDINGITSPKDEIEADFKNFIKAARL